MLQWGVVTSTLTPLSSASDSISMDSSMLLDPSSIPGKTCVCISIILKLSQKSMAARLDSSSFSSVTFLFPTR